MRKLFVLICMIICSESFGQKQIEKISFNETQEISVYSKIKNRTRVLEYTASDGSVIKVGDTLVLGTPSATETNTYGGGIGGDGIGAAVAKSKTKKAFAEIVMGKRVPARGFMSQMSGANEELTFAKANKQGEIVVVKEMRLFHKGSKKKPLLVNVVLGEPNGRAYGLYKYMSVLDFEKALINNEIKAKNAPLTREEAISKLKEAKELLDLEVIDQAKYDEIKREMTKIILKKK